MKILLTGSTGLLGKAIRDKLNKKYELIPLSNSGKENSIACDLRKEEKVSSLVNKYMPDITIHCAAYKNVDNCAENPKLAHEINVNGTRNLAWAIAKYNLKFIYISTDYVFDGEANTPYDEYKTPNPINVYGITKLGGENYISYLLKNYYIIRTGSLFGPHGENYVSLVVENLKNNKESYSAYDQFVSFTYTVDLANVILFILENLNIGYGIYHITNNGYCSRLELALKIAEILNENKNLIKAVSIDRLGLKAKRPKFIALSTTKFAKAASYKLKTWQEALEEFLTLYYN
jgi:dTDP-4-dehydrorhamnose reductase